MPPKKSTAVAVAQAKFAAVEKAHQEVKAECNRFYDYKRRVYENAMESWGLIERDSLAAAFPCGFEMATCSERVADYQKMSPVMDRIITELGSRVKAPKVSPATVASITEDANEVATGFKRQYSDTAYVIGVEDEFRLAERKAYFPQVNSRRAFPLPDVDFRDHSTHTATGSLPNGYLQLFAKYSLSYGSVVDGVKGVDPSMERSWRMQLLAKAASILPDCHVAWRLLFFYLEDGSETVKIGGLGYNAAQCLAKVVELLPRDFGSWWRLGVHLRTGPDPLTTVVRVSGESLRYTDCFMRAAKLQPDFEPCQECLKPEVPLPGGSLPPFRFPKLPKDSPEGFGVDGRVAKVATNGAAALVPQPEVAPVESLSQAHHPAPSLPRTGPVPTSEPQAEDSDLPPISTQSSSTSSVATEDLPTASDIDIDEFEPMEEPPKSADQPPQSLPGIPPSVPKQVPPVVGQCCEAPPLPSRSTASVATEDLPTASDIDIDEFEPMEELPNSAAPEPPQPVAAPIQPPRPRISVGVLAVGIGCTAVLAAVAAKYRRR